MLSLMGGIDEELLFENEHVKILSIQDEVNRDVVEESYDMD